MSITHIFRIFFLNFFQASIVVQGATPITITPTTWSTTRICTDCQKRKKFWKKMSPCLINDLLPENSESNFYLQ